MGDQSAQNLIFDLDGTLIDSANDIAECLSRACSEAGLKVRIDSPRSLVGPPLSETIQLLVPQITKGELTLAIAAFRRLYDSSDYPSTDLMPHAAEVLSRLRLKGKHLFVASNKASKPALRILSKLRLDDFFQAVYTVDSLPDRRMKKHEMVHAILNNFALMNLETAIVGDMVSDIEAAREAGIRSFAFLGGYGIEAELKSAKPDRCIADLRQLID